MKPLIILFAMACALASCTQKPTASYADYSPLSIECDSLATDSIYADTIVYDTLPTPATISVTNISEKDNGSFNGVSSRNSYGSQEILGFDDDVDDDNDMDAFMNDYHDDF
ncbi:MAG: hypothetical protein ACI30R_07070 [Sodaliphilus sp.]